MSDYHEKAPGGTKPGIVSTAKSNREKHDYQGSSTTQWSMSPLSATLFFKINTSNNKSREK